MLAGVQNESVKSAAVQLVLSLQVAHELKQVAVAVQGAVPFVRLHFSTVICITSMRSRAGSAFSVS